MIAWCGPRSDGLNWLYDRLQATEKISENSMVAAESLDELCALAPRRLIIAAESRVEFPADLVHHASHSWPEIPLAIATGSWFDGSRRTGIGTTPQLCLPWYRWWDGWHQWLGDHREVQQMDVSNSAGCQLLDKWPRMAAALTTQPRNLDTLARCGVIVSNCEETSRTWRDSLCPSLDTNDQERSSPLQLNVQKFHDWLVMPSMAPDWILWDDSAHDTFDGPHMQPAICESLLHARRLWPSAVIVVASSMPRWSDWQTWVELGANELIAKPSFGLPLIALLTARLLAPNVLV
jgi:hypothetical protein